MNTWIVVVLKCVRLLKGEVRNFRTNDTSQILVTLRTSASDMSHCDLLVYYLLSQMVVITNNARKHRDLLRDHVSFLSAIDLGIV